MMPEHHNTYKHKLFKLFVSPFQFIFTYYFN